MGLSAPVPLLDIVDVGGFVGAVIARHPGLSRSRGVEREDLESAGYELLFGKLRVEWDGRGTFSGFAAARLSLRLVDEWRRMNRGSRSAVFGPSLSWEVERERPTFSEARLSRVGDFARIRDDRAAVAA